MLLEKWPIKNVYMPLDDVYQLYQHVRKEHVKRGTFMWVKQIDSVYRWSIASWILALGLAIILSGKYNTQNEYWKFRIAHIPEREECGQRIKSFRQTLRFFFLAIGRQCIW